MNEKYDSLKLIEPEFVFLTAFSTHSFKNYLRSINV